MKGAFPDKASVGSDARAGLFLLEQPMPWKARDAARHTKKARSLKAKKRWSKVANRIMADGGSEASAIRQASAVIKRDTIKRRARKGRAKSN